MKLSSSQKLFRFLASVIFVSQPLIPAVGAIDKVFAQDSTTATTQTADVTVSVVPNVQASSIDLATVDVTSASLTTDKGDYAPTDTAIITGSGLLPNTTYQLTISSTDNPPTSLTVNVSTNDSGSFAYAYQLDGYYRPNYTAQLSLNAQIVATSAFTDASDGIDFFSQCANDDGDGFTGTDVGCQWTNGNLNEHNSTYHEDDATVQRLAIDNLTTGDHTVIIKYGTTKGGTHAYDFLTDDNFSELAPNALTASDLCDPTLANFSGCAAASVDTSALIPSDTHASGKDILRSNRHFSIRNGTWVNDGTTVAKGFVTAPILVSGTYAGDSDTAITLKFHVDSSTCNNAHGGKCEVLITWGAHVSTQADWGNGNSAINIPGSPYHVQVADVDGTSITGGGRDNQMSAKAIAADPLLIVIKHVINDNGGTAVAGDFTMNVTNDAPSPSSFPGEEAPGTTVTLGVGSYNVTESGPNGYAASYSADCTGSVAAGETKTCTVTNDDIQPKLTVTKVVVNDNGGTKVIADFPLFVGATGVTSGVQNGFNAGSYTVSETGQTGYTGVISGDCASDGSITLAPGDVKACTITNDDNAPALHLRKVVTNDNGGTATAADFTLTANGTGANDLSGTSPVDSGSSLKADTFALSETSVTGYSASDWVCVGGTQNGSNVTLGLGESATCTITNDDIAPALHLRKLVTNDNGGSAADTDWTLTANGTGDNDLSGATPVDSGSTLAADTFALSESGPTGYAASAWSCVGGSQNGSNITLGLAEEATCTITNDDIAPSLTLNKVVVNDNGGTAAESEWTLTADGGLAGTLSGLGAAGDSDVLSGATFKTGTYALSESTGPTGYAASAWVCSGGTQNGSDITLGLGESATCTITNDDIAPTLTIVKDAVPNDLSDFAFSGTLGAFTLDDDAAVADIGLNGDIDQPVSQTFTDITAGNQTITETEPNAFWVLNGASCVNTADGTPFSSSLAGTSLSVSLPLASDVTCTFVNQKLGPTRTQGFWQTHTTYTTSIYNTHGITVGNNALHKGPIDSINKLFGAYYASVSMKSTGKGKNAQRLAVDHSRMVLLQQLVTAKLNCAAFGCSATIQTLITLADAAYVSGDITAMQSYTSQLDAYNNSGDTIVILPSPGKATPQVSASLANVAFWDAP